MITKTWTSEDQRIAFYDERVTYNGEELSCDGEAEYQSVLPYNEEDGNGWTLEDLVITELTVNRETADGDWIEATELCNNTEIIESLIYALDK